MHHCLQFSTQLYSKTHAEDKLQRHRILSQITPKSSSFNSLLPPPQHIYFKRLETGGRWAAEGWNRSKGAKREGSPKDT